MGMHKSKIRHIDSASTEMELLDINVTKDSRFLLHAIHSPFYWRILKKTILFSGFKNSHKKICKTRKLESIHERKYKGRKLDKNLSLRRLEFMPSPEISTKMAVQ